MGIYLHHTYSSLVGMYVDCNLTSIPISSPPAVTDQKANDPAVKYIKYAIERPIVVKWFETKERCTATINTKR